MIDAFKWVRQY